MCYAKKPFSRNDSLDLATSFSDFPSLQIPQLAPLSHNRRSTTVISLPHRHFSHSPFILPIPLAFLHKSRQNQPFPFALSFFLTSIPLSFTISSRLSASHQLSGLYDPVSPRNLDFEGKLLEDKGSWEMQRDSGRFEEVSSSRTEWSWLSRTPCDRLCKKELPSTSFCQLPRLSFRYERGEERGEVRGQLSGEDIDQSDISR